MFRALTDVVRRSAGGTQYSTHWGPFVLAMAVVAGLFVTVVLAARLGMKLRAERIARGSPSRSRWARPLLVIVALPTAYIVVALVAWCVEGIINVGRYNAGTTATLVGLAITPVLVFGLTYVVSRRRSSRKIYAALAATSVTLPAALVALVLRALMNAPFL